MEERDRGDVFFPFSLSRHAGAFVLIKQFQFYTRNGDSPFAKGQTVLKRDLCISRANKKYSHILQRDVTSFVTRDFANQFFSRSRGKYLEAMFLFEKLTLVKYTCRIL